MMEAEIIKSSKNTIYIKALLSETAEKLLTNDENIVQILEDYKKDQILTQKKLDLIIKNTPVDSRYKEIVESLFSKKELEGLM